MKTNKMLGVSAILALSALVAAPAMAQGYYKDASGQVWKNASGQCWRAGYWTPSMATAECDPDLMPKPAPAPAKPAPAKPAAAPRAAPAPVPPVAKPKPAPVVAAKPARCDTKLSLEADHVFDFNKATLNRKAYSMLDGVVAKARACGTLEQIMVTGHTDRIGTQLGNLKLSEKRAAAVKAYLVKKGLPAANIEAMGMGKTMPIKSCADDKNRKALIACLAPNRRAEIEIKGLANKPPAKK